MPSTDLNPEKFASMTDEELNAVVLTGQPYVVIEMYFQERDRREQARLNEVLVKHASSDATREFNEKRFSRLMD